MFELIGGVALGLFALAALAFGARAILRRAPEIGSPEL
jgi:hypothetical protein